MLQPVSQTSTTTTPGLSVAPQLAPTDRSTYALDWRAPDAAFAAPVPVSDDDFPAPPEPSPGPSPEPEIDPVTPPPTESALPPDQIARAKESALLAADVYKDTPAPPEGFRAATQADLDRLGVTPSMLEQPGSSFRARVYATKEGGETRYVVAFRGSSSGEDWQNNFQQGLGLDSASYRKALEIGRVLAEHDLPVTMTGHSLGGGLASAAAIAAGRPADTFNAAGLHEDSIGTAEIIARQYGRPEAEVEAYRVPGEILTFVQEKADRAVGGAGGGLLGGILGGGLGALGGPVTGLGGGILGGIFGSKKGADATDVPSAYGEHHELPNAVPEGKGWIAEHSRIDRHMIDWVLSGAAAL